jgi:hypothetical protein
LVDGNSLEMQACDGSANQTITVTVVPSNPPTEAVLQFSWPAPAPSVGDENTPWDAKVGKRCMEWTPGSSVVTVSSAACRSPHASWSFKSGRTPVTHLVQGGSDYANACLTANTPNNHAVKSGTGVAEFQCWHLNGTQNWVLPAVGCSVVYRT